MILISGGLGYLGGRIAEHLLNSGFHVRIGSSRINHEIPLNLSSCEVVLYDLSDKNSLENACKNVSSIIHLASLNAQECNHDPQSALLINGFGTFNLLKAAEKMNVSKFIYFSTAHVYSSPLKGEIDESLVPRPVHAYSITHRLAEDYALQVDHQKSLSSIIFRLTNGVGSPLSRETNCWMLVVNDLCKQVVLNQSMELRSDELVQRDFFPISSVCSIVVSALKSNALNGEIVNISSGNSLTLRQLTDLIADRSEVVLGFRPIVRFKSSSKSALIIEPLIISNRKLNDIVHAIDTNISDEIDQLLVNCRHWFGG